MIGLCVAISTSSTDLFGRKSFLFVAGLFSTAIVDELGPHEKPAMSSSFLSTFLAVFLCTSTVKSIGVFVVFASAYASGIARVVNAIVLLSGAQRNASTPPLAAVSGVGFEPSASAMKI